LTAAARAGQPEPPVADRQPHVVRSPHGDRDDPYHWLRDDARRKRPEVLAHLRAENRYADRLLKPLAPLRETLVAEMRARIVEDDASVPEYDNGYWYWSRYEPGAEHPRLWRRRGTLEAMATDAADELLLDLDERARDHPYYELGDSAVSPDNRWLAFTEDTRGRRGHELRFRDLTTGEILPETVRGTLEPVVWAADSTTVFYVRQDPALLQSGPVWRHRRGTTRRSDKLVYDEADETLFVDIGTSASRRYLLIAMEGFDTTELRAVPLDDPAAAPAVVLARRDRVRSDADHAHGRWLIRTNEDAPNFRLVTAPEDAADDRAQWHTLVPGRDESLLDDFVCLPDGGVAICERVDATPGIRVLDATGATRHEVPATDAASTVALDGQPDPADHRLRYTVSSMATPETLVELDSRTGERRVLKQEPVPNTDLSVYRTERLWATAPDGARIPVSVAWRADRPHRDGSAPLLVTGYGAYGLPYDPEFSVARLSLLDRGFAVAIAHVRGGNELGEAWYDAGRLQHKANTFQDFVAATEHLIATGWGDPKRVFASGGSAGGLLIAAVANIAGHLYRGLVADVPFVDTLTTMLDPTIPLTVNEYTQWGNPGADAAAYRTILGYSPYDNLTARAYPAMLITGGLWDAQVQYFEPAKYVAKLRALKTDDQPLLLQINMAAGHQGDSGRYDSLDETAREYAFLLDLAGEADQPA